MNLDGRVMSVSATASVGVVDSNTILRLRQQGDRIFGHYGGASVLRGCLVGRMDGHRLVFRYAQVEDSGEIHGGTSVCDVLYQADGRARILEHFTWRTREGSGTNIFDEVRESDLGILEREPHKSLQPTGSPLCGLPEAEFKR